MAQGLSMISPVYTWTALAGAVDADWSVEGAVVLVFSPLQPAAIRIKTAMNGNASFFMILSISGNRASWGPALRSEDLPTFAWMHESKCWFKRSRLRFARSLGLSGLNGAKLMVERLAQDSLF